MAGMGRSRQIALGLALTLALLLAGCGGSGGEGGKHPDYAMALAGSPPPLAALHRQAGRLLPGGTNAYEKRIAALHGYPIVVNVWASWCGPCRYEFPTLQNLSARYGRRVAFLGVSSEDSESESEEFLEEDPVPYPSYYDRDGDVKESIGGRGFPDLAFYNRDGELVYFRPGPFAKQSELSEAVEQCALQERCESG
jgi:cytochrome c biogenesis protein CcmG, thiol:disulfide interchange protein DsbE